MSQTEPLIGFAELNHYLVPLGALNSPAELHGFLCGKLCAGQRLDAAAWMLEALTFLDAVTDASGVTGDPEGRGQAAIARLYVVSLAQLQDRNYGFELLLPSDDVAMAIRAAALGEWCHGFLTGFGSAGLKPDQQLAPECAEALRDLAAIVSISDGSDETEDAAEASFTEIVEYVRMAALTLFADLGQGAEDGGKILH